MNVRLDDVWAARVDALETAIVRASRHDLRPLVGALRRLGGARRNVPHGVLHATADELAACVTAARRYVRESGVDALVPRDSLDLLPPGPWEEAPASRPAEGGSARLLSFAGDLAAGLAGDLAAMLERAKATGALRLDAPDGEAHLFFDRGALVDATAVFAPVGGVGTLTCEVGDRGALRALSLAAGSYVYLPGALGSAGRVTTRLAGLLQAVAPPPWGRDATAS